MSPKTQDPAWLPPSEVDRLGDSRQDPRLRNLRGRCFGQRLHTTAAIWAEQKVGGLATQSDALQARLVVESVALGATMCGRHGHQGMCGTRMRRRDSGRFGAQLGHMDPDFVDFQSQRNDAELNHLARSDFLLRDRLIIDERPVGGLQVPDEDALLVERDFGMKGGNGRLMDDDVVRWIAPDRVQAAPEVEPEWHQQAAKMVEVHTPARNPWR